MRTLILLFVLAIGVFAQPLPPGVQKGSSIEGITEYTFPNGLHVLLFPDPSNPKVTVNMTVLVGSRHEGDGETGMAHLLEHMLFMKTTGGREIKKELTGHGASWNGSTSGDRTNYYETFTANDENLRWAVSLEADRLVNSVMDKALLDAEMTVVRNEFERGENNASGVLMEGVESTAYLWHNYGKPTIGSRAAIENVPIDRLAAFYRKYYQPDNVVLAIAGQLQEGKALGLVAETFGKIPHPARKLDATYTVEPAQDRERYVALRRVGGGQTVMAAYHIPAAAHEDSAALEVLAGVMSGGGLRGGNTDSGRLYKALVDNKKAISARMYALSTHDPGLATATAELNKDQSLADARRILIDTIEGLVSEPPTKEEVERVKTRLIASAERQMTNSQSVGLALSEWAALGDWRLLFLNRDRIKTVTPEDVTRVAKKYFMASNRTVGELGDLIPTIKPVRAEVPASKPAAILPPVLLARQPGQDARLPIGPAVFRIYAGDRERALATITAAVNGAPVKIGREVSRSIRPVTQVQLRHEEDVSFEANLKQGENQVEVLASNGIAQAKLSFRVFGVAQPITKVLDTSPGLKYQALVIGVNRYQHLQPLDNAVPDAEAVHQMLTKDFGFESQLIRNANREQILHALNTYRRELGRDTALLIYYSGHGYFDKQVGKAYWLPVEARNDDNTAWISADDVTTLLKGIAARHVLVVADSCYSGMLSRDSEIRFDPSSREQLMRKLVERPSRVLLASGGNEPVTDGGGDGHSVFASALLKGLSRMDTSVFTVEELFHGYIRESVAGRSNQVPECSPLRNSGHDGGTFIFERRRAR